MIGAPKACAPSRRLDKPSQGCGRWECPAPNNGRPRPRQRQWSSGKLNASSSSCHQTSAAKQTVRHGLLAELESTVVLSTGPHWSAGRLEPRANQRQGHEKHCAASNCFRACQKMSNSMRHIFWVTRSRINMFATALRMPCWILQLVRPTETLPSPGLR